MAVKTFSKKANGNSLVLSSCPNFKVKEFACNDGSDKILIDTNLVLMLQKIRNHFGKPVTINSAYRTKAYNTKVGGAPKSQHLLGKAADIRIAGVLPSVVANYADDFAGGVGRYKTFTHVDTRTSRATWNG